jgi:VWFA-related protein
MIVVRRSRSQYLFAAIALSFASLHCGAQTPATPVSHPTPPGEAQEPVRVFTEEVLVPIFVRDSKGHFDPTLEADDLLVFEDDVSQQIRSLRRVPSSVLLLLDTSGELNPAMNTNTTREIAINLVNNLSADDSMAAIQFGTRAELLQDWTTEKEQIVRALKMKLSSSKRAHLADALIAATNQLHKVGAGSRHVVLITDGVGSADDESRLTSAIRELLSSNATVHVISYTSVGRKTITRRTPLVKVTNKKRKSAKDIADELMNPTAPWDEIRRRKIYVIIDTDLSMRNRRKDYKEATKESERWLGDLADETGGLMLLPGSSAEMLRQGEMIAREIDTQYVVAYAPKISLATAADGEYRRIKVATRRGGLEVRTRRGYVATSR